MDRFIKLIAAVAGVGFLAVGTASAQSPIRIQPTYSPPPAIAPGGCRPAPPQIDIDYVVLYRTSPKGYWRVYAKVETAQEARRLEWRLERLGYQVDVQERFDRNRW